MAQRGEGREPGRESERLGLADAASMLLDECRMVLPGIQALFGFQLIAVFNQRFAEDLTAVERCLHLAAVGLVAIAVGIVMTPAAMHRHYGGREVTDTFIYVSTLLLLAAMLPLAAGLSLDFFLVARLILDAPALGAILATLVFAILIFLWMVFPRMRRLHAWLGRRAASR